mmetsp:Transcript_1036/g.1934  ORF Transcript_1036/g.1934 Transcript_1036/m.1934 type:complete len:204 (-) Transcript_1036:660-1271(-)
MKVLIFDVLLQLARQLSVSCQLVLIILFEIVQKLAIVHQLLSFIPILLRSHEQAHSAQHGGHKLRRLCKGLHLLNVLLVQRVQRLDCCVVFWEGLVQILLAVCLDCIGLCRSFGRCFLVHRTSLLLFLCDNLVCLHFHHELCCVNLGLLNHRLHFCEVRLQVIDNNLGFFEGLGTNNVSVQLCLQLASFLLQEGCEKSNELKI